MYNMEDIDMHYDKIYKYCHYKLRSRELAEDITQETFLRFFQRKQYQLLDTPLKLLYTIARNLCIDESRRHHALPLDDLLLNNETSPIQTTPENLVLTNHMLKLALSKLDATEREIIFLRLVNEEPLAVIAKTLQLSRYAVYRRYQHAITILRKELE